MYFDNVNVFTTHIHCCFKNILYTLQVFRRLKSFVAFNVQYVHFSFLQIILFRLDKRFISKKSKISCFSIYIFSFWEWTIDRHSTSKFFKDSKDVIQSKTLVNQTKYKIIIHIDDELQNWNTLSRLNVNFTNILSTERYFNFFIVYFMLSNVINNFNFVFVAHWFRFNW